jgi:hypothetical protein
MLPTHRRCGIVVHITTLVGSTLAPYLCLSCYRGIGRGKRRSLAMLYGVQRPPLNRIRTYCRASPRWVRDNHVRAIRLIPAMTVLGCFTPTGFCFAISFDMRPCLASRSCGAHLTSPMPGGRFRDFMPQQYRLAFASEFLRLPKASIQHYSESSICTSDPTYPTHS